MLPVNDLSGVLISNVKKIQALTLTFVRWSGTSENWQKSFDLAFHFSLNQNKLWRNWRTNRALLYNKPSILYQWNYICPSYRHVWESLIFSEISISRLVISTSRTVGSANKFVRITSGFGGGEFTKTLRKVDHRTNVNVKACIFFTFDKHSWKVIYW
jgi:hypothetical protein